MYLEYQNQNSHQTLREAIEEYHRYLTHIGRQILTDNPEDTDTIWLYHDATHAIFGQDTTIEGEAALDFWVFFGTTFSWKLLKKYQQLPEIKDLSRALISELGLTFIPKPEVVPVTKATCPLRSVETLGNGNSYIVFLL